MPAAAGMVPELRKQSRAWVMKNSSQERDCQEEGKCSQCGEGALEARENCSVALLKGACQRREVVGMSI